MRILHVTAGAGGSYCGTCIRDNALVRGLRSLGHEADLQPLYLPLLTEGEPTFEGRPVLMGGINVYLQHHVPALRAAPSWMLRPLDSAAALSLIANRAGSTQASEVADLTLAMLHGREGTIRRSVEQLQRDLSDSPRPDLILLSNGLLGGLAAPLRATLGAPVAIQLQGEPHYLRAMGAEWLRKIGPVLRDRLHEADHLLAVSHTARDLLLDLTGPLDQPIHVAHNGLDVGSYTVAAAEPCTEGPYTLGYIARLSAPKGSHRFLELLDDLRRRGLDVRGILGGTVPPGEEHELHRLQARAKALDLGDRIELRPNLTPEAKRRVLASLDLYCITTEKDETGALYAIEALAAGLPVVGPRRGAVQEILHRSNAGVLVEPRSNTAMADAVEALLADPARRKTMGRHARAVAEASYDERHMARRVLTALGLSAEASAP